MKSTCARSLHKVRQARFVGRQLRCKPDAPRVVGAQEVRHGTTIHHLVVGLCGGGGVVVGPSVARGGHAGPSRTTSEGSSGRGGARAWSAPWSRGPGGSRVRIRAGEVQGCRVWAGRALDRCGDPSLGPRMATRSLDRRVGRRTAGGLGVGAPTPCSLTGRWSQQTSIRCCLVGTRREPTMGLSWYAAAWS